MIRETLLGLEECAMQKLRLVQWERERDGAEESGEVWDWEDDWGGDFCEGEIRSEHRNWRERGHESARPQHHHQAQDGRPGTTLD